LKMGDKGAKKDSDSIGNRADLARAAFASGDVELSALAHQIPPTEQHQQSGEYAKTIVFGGLDGIITTFAVVTSVNGANLTSGVIIVLVSSRAVPDFHVLTRRALQT